VLAEMVARNNAIEVKLASPLAAGTPRRRSARCRPLWIRAVREGFQVLLALGVPVTPPNLRVFEVLPEPLLVAGLSRLLDTPTAELVIARHANAARAEYVQLGIEVQVLAHRAGVPMPAFERLRPFVDSTVPLMEAGSATLPLHWREVGPWACGLGVLAILASSRIRQLARR
jgi:hypothetical protein